MRFPHRGWLTGSIAIGLAVAGVTASVLVGMSVSSNNAAKVDHWIEERGEVIVSSTERTVAAAVHGLSALAALFENSDTVTQAEFEGFVNSLDPAIRLLAVAYTPLVRNEALDAYIVEHQVRDPAYSVSGFDADGELRPVSRDRSIYYPVELFYAGSFLLDSVTESEAIVAASGLGFDVGSDEDWRRSFEFSITEDSPTVSPFVDVGAGESTVGQAFIVSAPVHDDDGEVVGLVAAPMVDFLIATEVDSVLAGGVTWTISSGGTEPAEVDRPSWTTTIELPGTVWDLVVVPTEESLLGLSGNSPLIVVLVGFVLTSLITYLFLLAGRHSRTRGQMVEMERLGREKDRFLASVSHEIRTPLTVVAGLAQELRDRPQTFETQEGSELLSMIVRQSDEVASIVEDLLVAARADLGMVAITSTAIDLFEEASAVVEAAGVDCRIVGTPVWAWADPARVRQILRNLVSNSQRYGGAEKEVRFGTDEAWSWVEVADSGPPIPSEDRGRIFQAYVSSSDASDPSVGAMGLGLFISQRLAELLGGRLIYRHDGSFGIFTLRLPATEELAAESAA